MVDQLLFDFTNSQHGAFKNLLHIITLLRVHHLIVAVFQLSVDVDVLDVQAPNVLSNFILSPG
jgi:hypothetical protein